MIKFVPNMIEVVFEEIPDKISLCLNISNCQNNCIGCHSSFLKDNIGSVLDENYIDKMINKNDGINCVLFMGEGNDKKRLIELAKYVKNKYNIEIALYSGRENVEDCYYDIFDYIKIGPYVAKYGPLNKETTNQKLFYHKKDITYKFWKK